MKKLAIIYNPNSGKRRKQRFELDKYKKIIEQYDYSVDFYKTKYKNHAKEIIEDLPFYDLVISVGGDGTFNEVVSGNLQRRERLTLSHLPLGTTNDIGSMFGLSKNISKNLKLILTGKEKEIDICTVNDEPFVYVAGFGRFMNVPYETPRKLKKRYGYLAYLFEGLKDFFTNKTHLYDLTYEVNGEKYQGLYSFAIVSNANRIAGINNFYKDVKLDDNCFEVLFCNLKTKKDIVRSLFYLKTNDITKVPGFYFHKTDNLKVVFKEDLRKAWCIDGEELPNASLSYEIKVVPGLKMMLPDKDLKNLFIGNQK